MAQRNQKTLIDVEESDPHDIVYQKAFKAVSLIEQVLENVDGDVVEERKHQHRHLIAEGLIGGEDISSTISSNSTHRSAREKSCSNKSFNEYVVECVIDDLTQHRYEALDHKFYTLNKQPSDKKKTSTAMGSMKLWVCVIHF